MNGLHTTILVLHVLGATIIIGIAFVTFIIELKKFNSSQILNLTELIWKIAGPTLGVQLLTGLYLASSEWDSIGKSLLFWIKMFLFFVVGSIVGIVNKRRFERMKKNPDQGHSISWALIGLLAFLAVATLGVLIAESV